MRMPYCMGWTSLVMILAVAAGPARGDLVSLHLEEQTRWVRAFGEIEGQTREDVRDAAGFGHFDGYAEISLVMDEGSSWASSYAYASQQSVLHRVMDRTEVRYDMSIGAAYQDLPRHRSHVALGETFFEFVFRLDRPHRYRFSSPRDYTFAPHPNGVASWHDGGLFTEEGEAVVGDFWFQLVEQSGLLPEGRYVLRHHALLQPQNSIPETEALRFSMELIALPLPPGAWAGLATLAGLGAIAGVVGWRRRVHGR